MGQFPVVNAGQLITASLLQAFAPLTGTLNASQLVNSTTMADLTGCQLAAPKAGTYMFLGVAQYSGGQAAGTANFQVGVTPSGSFSSGWISGIFFSGTTFGSGQQSATLATVNSPTLTTGHWTGVFWGQAVLSAAATLSLQAAEGTASDTFTVNGATFAAWQTA